MPMTGEAIAIVTATLGTTLAPWGLSFMQSYAVDKKLRTGGSARWSGSTWSPVRC